MHYVWKGCDTTNKCNKRRMEMMPHCKRDWYDDWGCVECCNGDLCNYYVTVSHSDLLMEIFVTTSYKSLRPVNVDLHNYYVTVSHSDLLMEISVTTSYKSFRSVNGDLCNYYLTVSHSDLLMEISVITM